MPTFEESIVVTCLMLIFYRLILRKIDWKGSRVELVSDTHGNEALIMTGRISAGEMLFMVDTAYAGAPVLSTSYMAVTQRWGNLSTESKYRFIVDKLRTLTENDRHVALNMFLIQNRCRTFTSGCTMRLMGIGTTSDAHSDLLLTSGLQFKGEGHTHNSDVFMTNKLPSSTHILTIDFLLHRSPCVILPREERVLWWVSDVGLRNTFQMHTPSFVGGAPCVQMKIGGTSLHIVIDTGASASLSVSEEAMSRISICSRDNTPRTATQVGVHGERVCSDLFTVSVSIGDINIPNVELFSNSGDVSGADGYAGIGLLRMFDLWLSHSKIGFRRNGLINKNSPSTKQGSCGKVSPSCLT